MKKILLPYRYVVLKYKVIVLYFTLIKQLNSTVDNVKLIAYLSVTEIYTEILQKQSYVMNNRKFIVKQQWHTGKRYFEEKISEKFQKKIFRKSPIDQQRYPGYKVQVEEAQVDWLQMLSCLCAADTKGVSNAAARYIPRWM